MRAILLAAALATPGAACSPADAVATAGTTDVFTVTQSATPPADLTGTWRLDPGRSDRPGPPPGGQGRPGGHGPGGPGGPPDDGSGRPGNPPDLQIAQTDGTVIFSRPDGHADTLTTDGVARTVTAPNGDTLSVKAWWNATSLVVERSGGRGLMREAHTLSADGRSLTVVVHAEPKGQPAPRDQQMVFGKV